MLHLQITDANLQVSTYLLHGPDSTVPVEKQMEDVQKLYKEGRFERLGVSNYNKEQFLELYNYAKSKGYVLPTVFQSAYSLVVRRNEMTLFPTLRELGVSIQVYSPMAAGFLGKTPEYIEEGKGSWDPKQPFGQFLRGIY